MKLLDELKMEIDMSPEAIARRLEIVEELRELCLSLADSSAGPEIRRKHPDHSVVRRTNEAIGERPGSEMPGPDSRQRGS